MATSESPQWTLYYWQDPTKPMKGRGEYIRLMFEAAECPYLEINDGPTIVGMLDRTSFGSAAYPVFAPPVVQGPGGVCVSQTTAAMALIGKRFGLYPEEPDEFRALQIALSVADYHAEGRSSFHPVNDKASYYVQQEEAKISSAKFAAGRMLCWLTHFEHVLSVAHSSGYVTGDRLTYADIALFHVLQATEAQWPDEWATADFPRLKAFLDMIITKTPSIAAYLKSDRQRPWEGNSMM